MLAASMLVTRIYPNGLRFMEWKGREESENVEDARGQSAASYGGGMRGGGLGLLMTIGRVFGLRESSSPW